MNAMRGLLRRRKGLGSWLGLLVLALAGAAGFAVAAAELPGRVGRIADAAGEVLLSPQDRATDWDPVGINYPVTTGDNLWVSAGARAEIDYGGGQFRLAENTSVQVSRLDDQQLVLFVADGRVIVRVRVLDRGEVATVDTPNTQLQFTRPGLYRVEVDRDRVTTTVVVREGEAIAAIAGGAQQILPGQAGTLAGPEPAFASVGSGYGVDGFDSWSAARDRRYERSRTATYVSRQMVGWSDLDDYGTWETVATYGPVWYPTTVVAGWAPYRHGRWSWVGGWGWTWVDDAPWGYAPFHYGRWVWFGTRWGWCPGPYVARPVWAPALVGWYGGDRWGVSIGIGGPVFGWVPLGWGDPFIPWWGDGCGAFCWNHYNRPFAVPRLEHPRAVPGHYSNWAVPGAISAVAGATMVGHRPVATNLVRVPAEARDRPPVLTGAPTIRLARNPEAVQLRPESRPPQPASMSHPTAKPRLANPEAVGPATGRPAAAIPDRGRAVDGRPAPQSGQPPVRAQGATPSPEQMQRGDRVPGGTSPEQVQRGDRGEAPRAPVTRQMSPPATMPAVPRSGNPEVPRVAPAARPPADALPPALPRVAPPATPSLPPQPSAVPRVAPPPPAPPPSQPSAVPHRDTPRTVPEPAGPRVGRSEGGGSPDRGPESVGGGGRGEGPGGGRGR